MTENRVELEEWQRAEIAAGLAEAERGDFASETEVRRVFGKFKVDTLSPAISSSHVSPKD
jgi:predicted transcriptional regulator